MNRKGVTLSRVWARRRRSQTSGVWNAGVEQVALALQDIILHPPWGGGGTFQPARLPELDDE